MVRPMPTPAPTPNPDPARPLDGESLWPTDETLRGSPSVTFVKAVLVEMVGNRDVMWDSDGRPKAQALGCGETSECSWCHFEVDMSAIGMPTGQPADHRLVRGRQLPDLEPRPGAAGLYPEGEDGQGDGRPARHELPARCVPAVRRGRVEPVRRGPFGLLSGWERALPRSQGSHRRVPFEDLLAFKREFLAQRHAALDELNTRPV